LEILANFEFFYQFSTKNLQNFHNWSKSTTLVKIFKIGQNLKKIVKILKNYKIDIKNLQNSTKKIGPKNIIYFSQGP